MDKKIKTTEKRTTSSETKRAETTRAKQKDFAAYKQYNKRFIELLDSTIPGFDSFSLYLGKPISVRYSDKSVHITASGCLAMVIFRCLQDFIPMVPELINNISDYTIQIVGTTTIMITYRGV